MASRATAGTRHPSQTLALVLAIAFTLVGLLGFLVTGFEPFLGETDETLLGLGINPLHNIVHLLIGLVGLAMWNRLDTARTYGWLLFLGYGLVFLYGLFAAGNENLNLLNINMLDNVAHALFAAGGLAVAVMAAPDRARGAAHDTSTAGFGEARH